MIFSIVRQRVHRITPIFSTNIGTCRKLNYLTSTRFTLKSKLLINESEKHCSYNKIYKKTISSQSPHSNNNDDIQVKYYNKFKGFMKRYGVIGIGTYWITWMSVFSGFYWAFESGMVDYSTWEFLHLDKMEEYYLNIAPKFGIDTDLHPINPKTESALVALMASKVTKPLQWIFTWVATPQIARYLGYAPIPDKTLREKIQDKINNKFK